MNEINANPNEEEVNGNKESDASGRVRIFNRETGAPICSPPTKKTIVEKVTIYQN